MERIYNKITFHITRYALARSSTQERIKPQNTSNDTHLQTYFIHHRASEDTLIYRHSKIECTKNSTKFPPTSKVPIQVLFLSLKITSDDTVYRQTIIVKKKIYNETANQVTQSAEHEKSHTPLIFISQTNESYRTDTWYTLHELSSGDEQMTVDEMNPPRLFQRDPKVEERFASGVNRTVDEQNKSIKR